MATTAYRSLILVYFNKKWFFGSPISNLVSIDTAIINGQPTLFGTDGTNLYNLFSDQTVPVNQTIKTKLWDMGDPLANKQLLKFGLEFVNQQALNPVTGMIDTENSAGSIPFTVTDNRIVQWINNSLAVVPWMNNALTIVQWESSIPYGYAFVPMDLQTVGRYLGITVTGTNAQTVFEGFHMQYEHRTVWPQEGAQ
jgi:hypothetical protein